MITKYDVQRVDLANAINILEWWREYTQGSHTIDTGDVPELRRDLARAIRWIKKGTINK